MARPRPRPKDKPEQERRASSVALPNLERHSLLLRDGRYLIAYSDAHRDRDA